MAVCGGADAPPVRGRYHQVEYPHGTRCGRLRGHRARRHRRWRHLRERRPERRRPRLGGRAARVAAPYVRRRRDALLRAQREGARGPCALGRPRRARLRCMSARCTRVSGPCQEPRAAGTRSRPTSRVGHKLCVGFVCVSLSCVRRKQDSSLELGNAYSRELLINEHTMPAHPPYMRAGEK